MAAEAEAAREARAKVVAAEGETKSFSCVEGSSGCYPSKSSRFTTSASTGAQQHRG
ncbi:hypothetical protein COOONC_00653 [Cooperia oncophora]